MIARLAASLLAMAWAGGAAAQTPNTTADQAAASVAPDASNDDIIVTAQRRSERLVDVPLSVAAVSAEELLRSDPGSLEALNRVVPGVYIQRDVYGLSPTIRGIGSTLGSSGGESNVQIYVDGIYQPFKPTNIFDLSSVANVQVLKGPQGTLFGRNATGGAVLITTLDPSFEPEANFHVAYERFDTVRTSAYGNLPLTDQLAVNAAVSYRHSEGFINDSRTDELVNEGEDYAIRVKLLYEPSNDLTFTLTGFHSWFDDPTGSSYQVIDVAPFYELPGIDANSGPFARDRFHRSHNTDDVVQTESNQYSLKIDWDVGPGTIQSISAYQTGDLYGVSDIDNTYQTIVPDLNGYIDFRTTGDAFTQELNFTSNTDSALQYVAGIFYLDNDGTVPPAFVISGNPTFDSAGHVQSVSAYVDGSYRMGDWVLIGGLRYTQEERSNTFRPYMGGVPVLTLDREETENVWTPRIGVRYELSPDNNVYATYTRGYKAGIFDGTSATGNAVDPEFVDAYEIGYKTVSDRLTLNTAAYYYDFTDTQVNAIFSDGTTVFTQLFNVPRSEIYGVEFDSTYRFNDAWDIRAALAYTHARYTDFANAPGYQLATSGPLAGLIYEAVAIDASGSHMVRAPEWTASAAVNYHADVGGGVLMDASLNASYSSTVYFNFANTLSTPEYVIADANVAFHFNEHLTASAYVRNLTDEVYYTGITESALAVAGQFGMPRVYGVSLGYRF